MSSIRSTPLKSGLLALVLLAASLALNSLPAQNTATPPAAGGPPPGAVSSGGGPADSTAPATDTTGAAADTTGNGGKSPVTVWDMMYQGGVVMIILGIASVCLVWFTLEGFVILRANKLAPPALIARLKEAFKAGNYQEAWNICRANRCFLSNVLGNGLERVGRSKDAVEFIVEETALREANDLKTNTTYLSVIGVVSPMIGLTGTVWGMIGAFNALGNNGISNPALLAGKIGEVLIATKSGLVVAVPAFIFFYILRSRAQRAILHAESQVYRLLDEIPYDQLAGVRIGENFGTEGSVKSRQLRTGVSQKVSRNVTTNCPSCNAPITVGTSPCPNCQTVLDWGTS
jgi:biopolymer transport protein ExbB